MKKFVVYLLLFCFSGVLFPGPVPERMISLGPYITEDLFLLGVGNKIVGDTIYCIHPEEAKNKEKVGSILEVNVEKIVSLKPDIVFATSLTPAKITEELKNLGINVITLSEPKSFDGVCNQFVEIGRIAGKEKKARDIVKNTKKHINDIQKTLKGKQKKKVFVEIGSNPLFAATGDSFINDFIELAGGINIAKDAGSGIYSREEVVKRNPDIIIIAHQGISVKDEKKIWGGYKTINAVKNNKIFGFDSYKICSPNPENFPETLKEIVKIIN